MFLLKTIEIMINEKINLKCLIEYKTEQKIEQINKKIKT